MDEAGVGGAKAMGGDWVGGVGLWAWHRLGVGGRLRRAPAAWGNWNAPS